MHEDSLKQQHAELAQQRNELLATRSKVHQLGQAIQTESGQKLSVIRDDGQNVSPAVFIVRSSQLAHWAVGCSSKPASSPCCGPRNTPTGSIATT